MNKPFQFSMRGMFAAVSFLCIAAWSFSIAARDVYNANPGLWFISLTAAGAGIGAVAGKPYYGAAWGFLLAILAVALMPTFWVA